MHTHSRSFATLVLIALSLCATAALAADYRFDFGDDASGLQEGFTRVTPKALFEGGAAFGWVAGAKLDIRDKAFTEYGDSRRGKTPPPCWTCPLSEDAVVSDQPAEFVAKVAPGKYKAWVLCGLSYPYRSQYFDFDVTTGAVAERVQFEESCQFRHVFADVDATGGEARLQFAPRSLFAVCGVVLWQEADEARIQAEVLTPLRQIIDDMPPEEAAQWKLAQPVDSAPWPPVADADKQRGYLVHQRHWAEVVYPDTVPLAPEINPTLRAFATPGEYEPLNFIVYPFRELAGATVTVSALKGAKGSIPASAVDLRRVRYMKARLNYTVLGAYRRVPDPLMPLDSAEPLPANENTRYWLTVHVPATAAAGAYTGTVTFTPKGAPAATLPIRFRVLPIKLQEDPTKLYGIYYRDPLGAWASAKDETSKAYYLQKSEWEMQDLIAHGTRNITTDLWAAPEKPGEPGRFELNFDLMQQKVDTWKRYGLKGPFVLGVNAGGIFRKYLGKDLGSHISDAEAPPPEYGQELTRMCQVIEAERQKRGWPDFLYYPVDEPSTAPGAIAFMIETLKAVQAAGVKTYVTADPTLEGFAPLKPYIDVWCTQPFLPLRDEILKDKAARKVDYWCYPNHVNGENDHTPVNGARMTYGFGFWRSGFTTLIPWIYRANIGNPWNYLDGSASDFFNRTEDNGRPIPGALWEAYREGYDDYRYVYTCQQAIAKARKRGGKAAKAAAEAQKVLEYVWNQVRVQPKYKHDNLWEPRETDVYRWMVAEQIMKLEGAGGRTRPVSLFESWTGPGVAMHGRWGAGPLPGTVSPRGRPTR
ncbi:MAG: hypothetical protein COZ06_38625 [Armatimonadetes bacterium CG_4_10_14_3_um_filter_66_18]|nr:hypothetical protein [Armatimonadota bacterium]OIO92630.1 MAG: hypothetical protein AUJ96_31920 [Armatimonadetes bacterium CG2_30_66_41]PIU92687.1 MAG: hypothetical protein COS65_16580 [Armatimonadetes bacterium CG06_land_8_20_14_3_00_66_21]PIX46282.1 MAG: hypothetical protein COZ57_12890 [Armatimonadetes bacterium CG_4_8_14_3_um_filter_66_20]PIY35230.1 MAG: hypothetical protein COZ06_38625 [Armatimonadetes bacterium CG_4_10_14_3_um_filter_66_18]PIZ34374.1 MAG: hypothetical protein COY42_28